MLACLGWFNLKKLVHLPEPDRVKGINSTQSQVFCLLFSGAISAGYWRPWHRKPHIIYWHKAQMPATVSWGQIFLQRTLSLVLIDNNLPLITNPHYLATTIFLNNKPLTHLVNVTNSRTSKQVEVLSRFVIFPVYLITSGLSRVCLPATRKRAVHADYDRNRWNHRTSCRPPLPVTRAERQLFVSLL